ncbi:hypothetical protein BS50DRAFT_135402 [Corynespora cassiicola Philippines]|uniref:Uncharacterized protein n=1 Tax=Corynespora cassiicola Philippines TaxID=1448308 RepID=A0A2T2N9H3_CORCC|nr:hypothetical protein BS50DRAFT_135402 [Corynespora cassiicola Philippines]
MQSGVTRFSARPRAQRRGPHASPPSALSSTSPMVLQLTLPSNIQQTRSPSSSALGTVLVAKVPFARWALIGPRRSLRSPLCLRLAPLQVSSQGGTPQVTPEPPYLSAASASVLPSNKKGRFGASNSRLVEDLFHFVDDLFAGSPTEGFAVGSAHGSHALGRELELGSGTSGDPCPFPLPRQTARKPGIGVALPGQSVPPQFRAPTAEKRITHHRPRPPRGWLHKVGLLL